MHLRKAEVRLLIRSFQMLQRMPFTDGRQTGATAALLNYAKIIGQNGDIKTMDKICRLVNAKCNDRSYNAI